MFNFDLYLDLREGKIKKIHFLGIGGISMSGIALLLKSKGYEITGSDNKLSENVEHLMENDIEVYIGQKKENITDQDLFVYTDAIPENSEELIAARATGKPVVSRGVFLGALMRNYKQSIAISGSHGKSTTTSMMAKILIDSHDDASILLGGLLDDMKGNVKVGTSEILLTEACEFKGNILNYYPSTVVILNIDEDHLDYFKDLNHIVETFIGYIKNLDKYSKSIINYDDVNTHRLFEHVKGELITFSLHDENATYYVSDIEYDENSHPSFNLHMKDGKVENFYLQIIGKFNIINAVAAIIASYENGINIETIKESLKTYKTLHRRMETVGRKNDALVITDYAHHPFEIKSTLSALKHSYKKNIIAVFEPHQYSRTKLLLDDFSKSFFDADETIIADIYAARDPFDDTIHSRDLVEKINQNGGNAKYIGDFESIVEYLNNHLTEDDLVITLGAGNADKLAKMIVNDK